jgi:hypothetical protein
MRWIKMQHTYIARAGMFLGGQSYQLSDEVIAHLQASGARFEIVPAPWDRGKDPLADKRNQVVDLKDAARAARCRLDDNRVRMQTAAAVRDDLYRRYPHLATGGKGIKAGKKLSSADLSQLERLEVVAAEGRYASAQAEFQLAELKVAHADQAVNALAAEIAAAEAAAQPQPVITETTDATDTPTITPTDAGDGLAASVAEYEHETGITITNGHDHAGGQDAAAGNDGALPGEKN